MADGLFPQPERSAIKQNAEGTDRISRFNASRKEWFRKQNLHGSSAFHL